MQPQLNIHTHQNLQPGKWAIMNRQDHFDTIPASGFYAAGLHPWYLQQEDLQPGLPLLNKALLQSNVLALGECGLDKVCQTDYPLQQACFREQIRLANRHRKPMIIHCVKAFDDLMRLLKEESCAVPVIFHGFTKSLQLGQQLVKAGYYLSFGKQLESGATADVFNKISVNHVFLETDAADMDIGEVYRMAAAIKNLSVDDLSALLAANATAVFGIKDFKTP